MKKENNKQYYLVREYMIGDADGYFDEESKKYDTKEELAKEYSFGIPEQYYEELIRFVDEVDLSKVIFCEEDEYKDEYGENDIMSVVSKFSNFNYDYFYNLVFDLYKIGYLSKEKLEEIKKYVVEVPTDPSSGGWTYCDGESITAYEYNPSTNRRKKIKNDDLKLYESAGEWCDGGYSFSSDVAD